MTLVTVHQTLRSKSTIYRKSGSYANRVPRALRRWTSPSDSYQVLPPLVANSFPKSGTHLLLQILQAIPGACYYDSFISSLRRTDLTPRSTDWHKRKIKQIAPGEAVGAHLLHNSEIETALAAKNTAHFFIYRDPRDVVVSEAHYITNMNRWHGLHKYLNSLPDDESRIHALIVGISRSDAGIEYPDIAQRFRWYEPWIKNSNTYSLRYEDLRGPQQRDILRNLIDYWSAKSNSNIDANALVDRVQESINPGKSHTFRSGHVASWKTNLTEFNKGEFRRVAGQILIDHKFEGNMDW